MDSHELDFDLPPELIAQEPAPLRSQSRLLHYRRADGSIVHRTFHDLPNLLTAGDLLVMNDARVLPARFMLQKSTRGRIEGLFLSSPQPKTWLAMLRNLGSVNGPVELTFVDEPSLRVVITGRTPEGDYVLKVESDDSAEAILARLGRMPLPPYIRRDKHHDPRDAADHERYQTVFAKAGSAVAAPTAALHFTDELLSQLAVKGIDRAFVTLNVGIGTFKPLTTATLEAHVMHEETYTLPEATVAKINETKHLRRRVIAVGTTSARVLESQPAGKVSAITGATRIFIHPPYTWKHVDALITNFHLPKSTLIALVAGLVGLDEQRRIYSEAISQRYRFFSYGDAMLIE